MRRAGGIVKLEIVAEHVQKMLFQPHDQRVDPGVEDHICAFEPHLRRMARREVLHMYRGRDHGAGDTQPLADMPFHLRAQDQFRLQGGDGCLDLKIIVGDQRLDPEGLCGGAQGTGLFAVVAAHAAHLEADLVAGDFRGGNDMGGIAEQEHALAGQIGRIDRGRPPGLAQTRLVRAQRRARQGRHFGDEGAGGGNADRDGFGEGLSEGRLAVPCGGFGGFGIEQHVEMRGPHPGDVGGARPHWGGHVHVDAHLLQQRRNLGQIIAVAKAQCRRPQDVATDPRRARHGPCQMPDDLQEGLVRAEVFLALIRRQVQRDDRDRQPQRLGQPAGIVLDQLCRARGAHDDGFRLEPVIGVLRRGAEQVGGVAAQIAGLKGGVADRRALGPPFDHGEQEVRIGIALRGVQHVMQPLHRGGDTHGTDMGRAFICPDGQLHDGLRTGGASPPQPGHGPGVLCGNPSPKGF